jgi:site-specific DNA recombinase
MFEEHWNDLAKTGQARSKMLKAELAEVEKQIEQTVARFAESDVQSIITACETRIRKLDEEKTLIAERIANCGRPLRSFDESLRTAVTFLANPYKLWLSPHIDDKRAVLRLAFDERLPYDRNKGLRTAPLALPFKC